MDDFGYGIAIDPLDNAYIVGQTASKDFAETNAAQPFLNGTNDTFLAKIWLNNTPPTLNIAPDGTNVVVSRSAFLQEYQVQFTFDLTSGVWDTFDAEDFAAFGSFTNGLQLLTIPTFYSDTIFFRLYYP